MLEWMEDSSLQMKGWKSAVPALFCGREGLFLLIMQLVNKSANKEQVILTVYFAGLMIILHC